MSLKIINLSTKQKCYHKSIGVKKIECENYSFELRHGINFMVGDIGWLCSFVLSMSNNSKIQVDSIYLNESKIELNKVRKISYYVNYNEFKCFHKKIKLKRWLKNETKIIKAFELTERLLEKNFYQLEHWSYLCSCAIGIMNNKKILCFPLIPEKEVRIQSYRFKLLSKYALLNDLYVIIPINHINEYTKETIDYMHTIVK